MHSKLGDLKCALPCLGARRRCQHRAIAGGPAA